MMEGGGVDEVPIKQEITPGRTGRDGVTYFVLSGRHPSSFAELSILDVGAGRTDFGKTLKDYGVKAKVTVLDILDGPGENRIKGDSMHLQQFVEKGSVDVIIDSYSTAIFSNDDAETVMCGEADCLRDGGCAYIYPLFDRESGGEGLSYIKEVMAKGGQRQIIPELVHPTIPEGLQIKGKDRLTMQTLNQMISSGSMTLVLHKRPLGERDNDVFQEVPDSRFKEIRELLGEESVGMALLEDYRFLSPRSEILQDGSFYMQCGKRIVSFSSLPKDENGSTRVTINFGYAEDIERAMREISQGDDIDLVLSKHTGDLNKSSETDVGDAIKFMVFMKGFLTMSDKRLRFLLNPSDERRKRIYQRHFKELGDRVVLF